MRLHDEFGLSVSDDTIYRASKDLNFSHVSARPKAYNQDAEAMAAFKTTLPLRVTEVREKLAPCTPIEVWFQDEMRVDQKNKLTYRWAKKGSRPRAIHDQRTQSTYLFGAVCPELGTGAALVLPACNTGAMQLHLTEIAIRITPGAVRCLSLIKPAGTLRKTSSSKQHLARAAAAARARIWRFMRKNWLSNRVFKSFDDIVDHCCFAWNTLIDQPWKIMSMHDAIGQSSRDFCQRTPM